MVEEHEAATSPLFALRPYSDLAGTGSRFVSTVMVQLMYIFAIKKKNGNLESPVVTRSSVSLS